MKSLTDPLRPGEKVLWRGSPRGYPFSCGALATYVVILFLCGMPFFCISCDVLSTVTNYKLGLGTVTITYDSLGDGILTSTVPSPLVGLVPIVLYEIWRTTAWWDHGYWITDQRVLETDRRGRHHIETTLDQVKALHVRGSVLEITSHAGRILRFDGVDDVQTAREILAAALPKPPHSFAR